MDPKKYVHLVHLPKSIAKIALHLAHGFLDSAGRRWCLYGSSHKDIQLDIYG